MRRLVAAIGMVLATGILAPQTSHAYTCSIEGDPNGVICKTIMSLPNPVCQKYGCR